MFSFQGFFSGLKFPGLKRNKAQEGGSFVPSQSGTLRQQQQQRTFPPIFHGGERASYLRAFKAVNKGAPHLVADPAESPSKSGLLPQTLSPCGCVRGICETYRPERAKKKRESDPRRVKVYSIFPVTERAKGGCCDAAPR